jgi:hypothetical protein
MSASAEINRANAQHSTGPTTPEGKHRSSQNSLRHGLTAQIVVMPNEDLEAYHAHMKSFTDEYDPQGATETHLVQSLTDTSWRQNRIAAIEANVLKFATMVVMPENDAKALASLSLHSQRLARQFERTVNQLRALQETRQTEVSESKGETSQNGFVSSPAQITRAIRLRQLKKTYKTAQPGSDKLRL